LNGIDAELLDRGDVMRQLPYLDYSTEARFPIRGGLLQRRAGTVRHDAVAWGYARAAASLGVDIIEHCEVTGFVISQGQVTGVETTRGRILSGRTAIAVAGHSSHLAAMAGLRLPIESHLLQAFVSEPIKPFVDHVISFGASCSTSPNRTRAGWCLAATSTASTVTPREGNSRKCRPWPNARRAHSVHFAVAVAAPLGGHPDMTPDGSPFICRTPLRNLYLDAVCYQGSTYSAGVVPGAHHRDINCATACDR